MIPNVLAAAVSRGCTMLHPGYGFLAENAFFVDMCKAHGVNFIGPNVSTLKLCWFCIGHCFVLMNKVYHYTRFPHNQPWAMFWASVIVFFSKLWLIVTKCSGKNTSVQFPLGPKPSCGSLSCLKSGLLSCLVLNMSLNNLSAQCSSSFLFNFFNC